MYSGLIRIHILFHACAGSFFGLGMIEELSRRGYRLSPGTLYPLLHGLEQKGLLRSRQVRSGHSLRRAHGRAGKCGSLASVQQILAHACG